MSVERANEVGARARDLSLREKIGQMLILGWGGDGSRLALNEQTRVCARELHAGGMIVMGRNLHDTNARPAPPIDAAGVRAMLDSLQSLAKIPLLVATDQEGGRVARFGSAPFTRMPSARELGATEIPEFARDAARITGEQLRTVGVNFNFAPVADIDSNPNNPVIGDRSFGTEPKIVAQMVAAQIAGYRDSGVLSCLKHFPGHGDTSQDSHFDLPTLSHDPATIAARELVPFSVGIDAGVPAIMTAHILFSAFDRALPATLSHAILTGILRQSLKFTGLIVTDCLEMKAVSDHWGTARAAVEAAKAGADLLLVCHTLERQRETFDALLSAVESGELPMARVDESVSRILAAKRALPAPAPFDPSLLTGPLNAESESLEATTIGAG